MRQQVSTGDIAATTIGALLTRYPSAAAVFVRHRLHCVGCSFAGFETVADVARCYGLPLDGLLVELQDAISAAPPARGSAVRRT